ncbi:MAG: LysE family transporter [Calditrichia bacterium]
MNSILVFPLAYVMGFLTAIPVGATQVEIAKRSFNDRLLSAFMVVAGSVSSDMMYGFIALYGIAPFLRNKNVMVYFWLTGTIILWILAFFTFRQVRKIHKINFDSRALKNRKLSYITGFSLAVTNPMMIFWWLFLLQLVRSLNLLDHHRSLFAALFIVFGGMGLASYLSLLAYVLHRVKKFMSERLMKRIYFFLGIILVIVSIYFLIRSILVFFK